MSCACKPCVRVSGLHDKRCGCGGRAAAPPSGPHLQACRQVLALRARPLVQLQRLARRVRQSGWCQRLRRTLPALRCSLPSTAAHDSNEGTSTVNRLAHHTPYA